MIPDAEVDLARQEAREHLIAKLDVMPEFIALRELLDESEQEWLTRVARSIRHGPKPVDQRKIDLTVGHFKGAHHYLNARVKAAVAWVEKKESQS